MYNEQAVRDARNMENAGNWSGAAKMWRLAGAEFSKDVEAYEYIADAIAKGDGFRARVDEELGPEPEFTPATTYKWTQWHRKMNEIHRQMFKP